ncbi:ArsR/SmtB family transcription factor [Nonomuraea sediminis]|uniref:ArsR/SmtB family transcription factor n=1 Tax=Nonomuraea sediminis TaxID=2835864 RepID=UPI001BDBFEDF|nr:metalloregulator ArsR/SmtB family transcription factor [Nonomuraea sediminis]
MSEETCELLCLDLPLAEGIRESLPHLEVTERAAATAKAVADPTRLRIAAALLRGGELCVCDLAWVTGLPQNLVSHHVRLLRTAGLARSRRDGRMVMYTLTGTGQALLNAVMEGAAR